MVGPINSALFNEMPFENFANVSKITHSFVVKLSAFILLLRDTK